VSIPYEGDSGDPNVPGLTGTNSAVGFGVRGDSTNGFAAVHGHGGHNGVWGYTVSANDSGVFGQNDGSGNGVAGASTNGLGVRGDSTNGFAAVHGHGGHNGVWGYTVSANDSGVFGQNDGSGNGVTGRAGSNGNAVVGVFSAGSVGGNAIWGIAGPENTNAGQFDGHVQINGGLDVSGELTVLGGKHFRIDHPCDPANKYLLHCSVEAPEMMNMYNGNVTTDGNGEAVVILPDYFEALNCDFRYQLTPIGQFSQAIVATEIAGNRFSTRTDKPKVKVSWQVSGVRKDVYARANPTTVEQEKSAGEKGFYLHPQLYGQPFEKGLTWARGRATPCAA
jgi:hypothetical protein